MQRFSHLQMLSALQISTVHSRKIFLHHYMDKQNNMFHQEKIAIHQSGTALSVRPKRRQVYFSGVLMGQKDSIKRSILIVNHSNM